MASSPITSWQIEGENVEVVTDFLILGSKITADGDCFHETRRCLLLGQKAMTNIDHVLKSRDITLPTEVCIVKAVVFPVVLYGCESWMVKKAEHQRTDVFELRCWRRFLKVLWTAKRSNQSILRETNPEYWLEGLMLRLKLQYLIQETWVTVTQNLRFLQEGNVSWVFSSCGRNMGYIIELQRGCPFETLVCSLKSGTCLGMRDNSGM